MLGSGQQNLNVANGLNAIDGIVRQTAGNKDAIKRLIQSGIISEMQGVLAGMRADEISKAGMLGKGNMPTIAQQVLSPQPEPDMAPAPPPQMGMPGMSAPAPQMGVPSMPEEAPQDMPEGMAEGGLASLPVPDDMFNSAVGDSDTQHYAPGGLVAFARGGSGMTLDSAYERILQLEGGLGPNGEMRVSPAGAVGPAQLMPATAPEAAKLAGLPWDERRFRTDPDYNTALGKAYYASRVAARGGDYAKAALDYHSGMGNVDRGKIGPQGREYARRFGEDAYPERDMATASGRIGSLEDLIGMMGTVNQKSPEETATTDKYRTMLTERASDEYYEKQRKEDMWATLAQIGFNMASSKSPFVLQAIGEAAAAAMPGALADKKERKAAKDRAIEGLMELGARDRKEAVESLKTVIPIWQEGARAEQFEKEYGLRREEMQQRGALAREGFTTQKEIAAMRPESMDFRESFARRLFDEYRQRNATGQLYVNGKRLPPNSKSDAELYALAMQEVVNRMPQGQGAGMMDLNGDRVPDPLGGRSGSGQQVLNTSGFKVLGTE